MPFAPVIGRCSIRRLNSYNWRITMRDLFSDAKISDSPSEAIAKGASLLRGKALQFEGDVLAALRAITAQARFRHMTTRGGYSMSVAMTNSAAAGWITHLSGDREHTISSQRRLR